MIKVSLICLMFILRASCDVNELTSNGWKDSWSKYNQFSFPKSFWQPIKTPLDLNPSHNNYVASSAPNQPGYIYNVPDKKLNYTTASSTTEIITTPPTVLPVSTKPDPSTTSISPSTENPGYWYSQPQQLSPQLPDSITEQLATGFGSLLQHPKKWPQQTEQSPQLPQQSAKWPQQIAQWLYELGQLVQQPVQVRQQPEQFLQQLVQILQAPTQKPAQIFQQPKQSPQSPEFNLKVQNPGRLLQQFNSWLQSGSWSQARPWLQQPSFETQQPTFGQHQFWSQVRNSFPQSGQWHQQPGPTVQQPRTSVQKLEQWLQEQRNLPQQFGPRFQFSKPCPHNINQQSILQPTVNSIQQKPVIKNKDNDNEGTTPNSLTMNIIKESTLSLPANSNTQIDNDQNSVNNSNSTDSKFDEVITTIKPEPTTTLNNSSKEENESFASYKEIVSNLHGSLPLSNLRLNHYSRIIKDIKPESPVNSDEIQPSSNSSSGIIQSENSADNELLQKTIPQISTLISESSSPSPSDEIATIKSNPIHTPSNQYLPPYNHPQIPQRINYYWSIKNDGAFFPGTNNGWKTSYDVNNLASPGSNNWNSDIFEENSISSDENNIWNALSSAAENNDKWNLQSKERNNEWSSFSQPVWNGPNFNNAGSN